MSRKRMYNTMYATQEPVNDTPLPTEENDIAESVEEETTFVKPIEQPVINEPSTKKYRVTTPVNFRIDPDTEKKNIIGVFKKGVEVNATVPFRADGWAAVEYENKYGYVKAEYLEEV